MHTHLKSGLRERYYVNNITAGGNREGGREVTNI